MAKKPEAAEPCSICESGRGLAAQLDLAAFKETGVLKNVAIFAPPFDAESGHYISDKGVHYARSFFDSVAEAADGANSWSFHPDKTTDGGYKFRDPLKAIGRTQNTAVVQEGAKLIVRGDFKAKKTKLDEIHEAIAESGDSFGFSVWSQNVMYEIDPRTGRRVMTGIDRSGKRPLSVDFVESSGATTNVFESADGGTTKENAAMTDELKSLIEAERLETKKQLDALRGGIAESAALKTKLDGMEKTALVNQRIAEKKADGFVTPGLRKHLAICESAADMDALIEEQRTLVAAQKNPVHDAGADGIAEGAKGVQAKHQTTIDEVAGGLGFQGVVEGLCAVAESGSGREPAIAAKVLASPLARCINYRDQSEGTKKLRASIREQADNGSISLRRLYEKCVGHQINSPNDVIFETTGTPLLQAAYPTVNTALLASIFIPAWDIAGETLIADRLAAPYKSTTFPETYGGFTAATGGSTTAEGALPNDATFADKYVTDPASMPAKRTVFFSVSREAVYRDQLKQVVMRGNRVAEDERCAREIIHLKGIFELGGVQSYRPAGAASPVFVAGNTKTANPLADKDSIVGARNILRRQQDENSRYLLANRTGPLLIVVEGNDEERANEIVNTTEFRRMNSGGELLAIFQSSVRGTQVLASDYLQDLHATDTISGAWYAGTSMSFHRQVVLKQFIPFEVVQPPAAEIQAVLRDLVAGIKAEWEEWILHLVNKHIEKNTVA